MGVALLIGGTLLFRNATWYFGTVPLSVLVAFAFGMSCQTVVAMLRPILLADLAPLKIAAVDHSQRTFIIVASAALWAVGQLTLERSLDIAALASVISVAILILFLRHDLSRTNPFDWSWLRKTTVYGLKMAASGMLLTLTSSLSVLIIRSLLEDGFTQVGFYTRAVAIATMVVIVPRSLSLVFYAKWSLASSVDKVLQTERAARFNVGYGCIAALLTLVLGKQMIRLLYGVEFLPANGVLQILAPAMVLQCLFSVFNSLLASEGRAATTTLAMAGTLIIVVGSSLLLVPAWGIYGAATAVLLGNLFSAGFLFAACRASHRIAVRRILIMQCADFEYLIRSLRH